MSSTWCHIPPGTAVLVTGATGFTGVRLVRKLVESGVRVKAIARHSSILEQLADLPIEWVRGNVFDPQVVEQAAAGVEYIFHVAALYREAKVQDIDYVNVHVVSTKLLAEAASKNANFKRFLHVSTVGVHGHIDQPPADENYRFAPGDMYQQTKVEGELWIRDFAAKSGLPLTVIRPAAIYGPGDRRLLKVFKLAKAPIFPILGFGKCLYHLIHIEDLTNIFILAATHPQALGEVFIAGNPESVTLVEMARIVAEECGKKLRVLRIPAWPFFLLGGLCELIWKPLGKEPPIYRRRVAFFTKDRSFNTQKLRQRLGYTFTFSNEAGIRDTARWYIAQHWI